jgi:hypothetical protein
MHTDIVTGWRERGGAETCGLLANFELSNHSSRMGIPACKTITGLARAPMRRRRART